VKLDPIASTSKATPAKGPIANLRQLPPVNYSKDLKPSDEESDDQTISGTKCCPGRASKKQERLKQKERDHKAVRLPVSPPPSTDTFQAEAAINSLTTQLCDSAITLIEGRDNFSKSSSSHSRDSSNPSPALIPFNNQSLVLTLSYL
jgi:hypothetical protein